MIFNKIHLHPILILFIILSLLTGTFIQLITLLTIVFIHELGHVLAATYFKWRIESIMLWVFGGVMKTDETTNPTIKEEIVVTVAGPFQHLIVFVLLQLLAHGSLIPEEIIKQAHYYNGILLLFNLLPIYPLDGGKLIMQLQAFFRPYYTTLIWTYALSLGFCIILIIIQFYEVTFTWSAFALSLFLLIENIQAWRERYYTFMRFLLNRLYLPRNQRVLMKSINKNIYLSEVLKQFQRDRIHHFYIQYYKPSPVVITENECLELYFKHRNINATIDDVVHYHLNKN